MNRPVCASVSKDRCQLADALARAERAEAALNRVRALCVKREARYAAWVYVEDVRAAIEGQP